MNCFVLSFQYSPFSFTTFIEAKLLYMYHTSHHSPQCPSLLLNTCHTSAAWTEYDGLLDYVSLVAIHFNNISPTLWFPNVKFVTVTLDLKKTYFGRI